MRKYTELKFGCMAKAGDNEMTFVLLSRDITAPRTIRYWAQLRVEAGKNNADDIQIIEALECAKIMEIEKGNFRPEHGTSWRPITTDRKDVIGVRDLPDGRKEFLMYNGALCNPYYTSVSENVSEKD